MNRIINEINDLKDDFNNPKQTTNREKVIYDC